MKSKEEQPPRRITARGIRKDPPDLQALARAFIELAKTRPPDQRPASKGAGSPRRPKKK